MSMTTGRGNPFAALLDAPRGGPVALLASCGAGPTWLCTDAVEVLTLPAGDWRGAWQRLEVFLQRHAPRRVVGWLGYDLGLDVEAVDLTGPVKTVTTGAGDTFRARSVILAMGAAARYLGVPGEQELLGRGVSACATCDGFFFKDQDIAVIGGGDSAMEEATFLTRFARSVTLVHRREEFRASRIMLERAQANEKIRFLTNTTVLGVEGTETVTGLLVHNTVTGEDSTLDVTGVFVAIGHDPRSELVADVVDHDPDGYVLTRPGSTETSIGGVFAAGDLVDRTYRQAITAAGSGCAAAIDAERWLAEHAEPAGTDTDLIGAEK